MMRSRSETAAEDGHKSFLELTGSAGAKLNAARPEGLPKVPDTVSPKKVENKKDIWAGAGDAPATDLPRQDHEIGRHPEAAGSRTGTEELWSEVKRDLEIELEQAGMMNGEGGGPHEGAGDGHQQGQERDLRPGGGGRAGNGQGLPPEDVPGLDEERGRPGNRVLRPGVGGARQPDHGGSRLGDRGRSGTVDLQQEEDEDDPWEEACRRTRNQGGDERKREPTTGSGRLTPLNLDCG